MRAAMPPSRTGSGTPPGSVLLMPAARVPVDYVRLQVCLERLEVVPVAAEHVLERLADQAFVRIVLVVVGLASYAAAQSHLAHNLERRLVGLFGWASA